MARYWDLDDRSNGGWVVPLGASGDPAAPTTTTSTSCGPRSSRADRHRLGPADRGGLAGRAYCGHDYCRHGVWLIDGATEAIDKIRDASHNDDILDFVVVDTRSTFAEGKTLREMADEVGLLDLYRQTYQLQSGIAHSEWWSVEIHAMERCLNILHRGHLIPSLDLTYGGNVEYAGSWVIALYGLMRMSLSTLGTSKEAVDAAFSWLTQSDEVGAGGEDEGAGPAEVDPA